MFLVDHFEDFRLVAVGQEIMGRIDVGETLLIVGSPLVIDEFILVCNFSGIDRHAVDQLLGISSIVFRELHVDEASKGMSVSSDSHDSILISMPIDHLLLQSSLLIPGTSVGRLLSINSVITEDSFPLLSVELFDCIFLLFFNLCLVIFLQSTDLCLMFLLEFKIFLHDTVHVIVINIHVNDFFAFLQTLVFVFQTQFLGELLFKSAPFVVFVKFGAFTVVDCCLMSLVVFRFVTSNMRIHIERFLMISIDDSSDGIFGVSSSVRFQSCLIKVILIFSICQRAGIWLEFLNILFDFFETFLLAFCLFFKFFLTNSFPDCNIFLVACSALCRRISRTRAILRVE